VPLSVKIFLTALAIVDDLGAVLVIAFFYTAEISLAALGFAALIFIILAIIGIRGTKSIAPYAILGTLLWFAMLKSGVHATIAGVLAAITVPVTSAVNTKHILLKSKGLLKKIESLEKKPDVDNYSDEVQMLFQDIGTSSKDSVSPLHRLEHMLHPWVSYAIMPIFALANAGVNIGGITTSTFLEPVSMGIIIGLVLGKQIGVTFFSWLAVKLNLASLPGDIGWKHIYGAGWLAGIGFTMSLFIAALAFGEGELLKTSKIGILGASFISALVGLSLLYSWTKPSPKKN